MKSILTFLLAFSVSSAACAFTTKAKQAIVLDYNTETVMFETSADDRVAPASMSKLMTIYMVMERLKDGTLSVDDHFVVSENAWKRGGAATKGSTMFLKPNSKVKVIDLLRGIIIQSGNDACIVVAENMAGSEGRFAEEMNEKAKKLGLYNSQFRNSTGLPEEGHFMSVRDIAELSRIIITNFPEYYPIFSEKNFRYNNITQGNRNPLLYKMPGMADGLKTGHTSVSGYGVSASILTLDKKRRIILVVNGLDSMKEREEESYSLMQEALNAYDNYIVYKAGETVSKLPVFLGNIEEVPVTVKEDLVMTLPRFKRGDVEFKVAFENPVKAPVKSGDKLGMLMVKVPGLNDVHVPVYAAKDVSRKGYFGRLKVWFKTIF